MTAATPQSQAVQIVNQLLSYGAQLRALNEAMVSTLDQWTQVNAGAIINALPTVALNVDGSLGTADATPVSTNPIDTSKVSLNRAISANDITVLNTLLTSVTTLIGGAAAPAQQASFPQVLDKIIGG